MVYTMQNFAALQTIVRSLFSDQVASAWQDNLNAQVGQLLQSSSSSKRDNMAAALTGRVRSDAGMLRQAGSNVREAQGMMEQASTATGNIKDMLAEAKDIADKYTATSDPVLQAQLEAQYDSIKSNLNNIIKSTSYNGISLLDGNAWAADKRVNADAGNNSGAVQIWAGNSGFDLNFSNMRKAISDPLASLDLSDANTALKLDEMSSTAGLIADVYSNRASSLKGQAASLERQAGILDEVAASQGGSSNSSSSLKDILAELALRDKGSIFNSQS